MHRHDHCGCEHNLVHCKCCDVVYCTKCHREWGTYHWYSTWSNTTVPYKGMYPTNVDNALDNQVLCTHT